MSEIFVWILVCFGITGGALIWRNKRRFDRLNEHGVPQYGSYSKKAKAEAFDKFLLVIAYLSAFAATAMLMVSDPEIMVFGLIALFFFYWVRVKGR